MSILVTEAGGFIGRQVAAALVAAGHQVAPGVRGATGGLQLCMRQLAEAAAVSGQPLPGAYRRCFWLRFALAWPAFLGVIAIFAPMVWKPVLWAT